MLAAVFCRGIRRLAAPAACPSRACGGRAYVVAASQVQLTYECSGAGEVLIRSSVGSSGQHRGNPLAGNITATATGTEKARREWTEYGLLVGAAGTLVLCDKTLKNYPSQCEGEEGDAFVEDEPVSPPTGSIKRKRASMQDDLEYQRILSEANRCIPPAQNLMRNDASKKSYLARMVKYLHWVKNEGVYHQGQSVPSYDLPDVLDVHAWMESIEQYLEYC